MIMANNLETFINTKHKSVREVIEDFWNTQTNFLIEADEDLDSTIDNALSGNGEEPSNEETPDEDPLEGSEDEGVEGEDKLDDDAASLDDIEDPDKDKKSKEEAKETFANNLNQLRQLQNYVNITVEKTNNKEIIKLQHDINSLLMTITNTGESVLDLENLQDINYDMAVFIDEVVMKMRDLLMQYNNNADQKAINSDFATN
jgi:hypothetical protein